MPLITFDQVGAFALRPFAGNSAAIPVLAPPLADKAMWAVAEENNIVVAAFVCRNSALYDRR